MPESLCDDTLIRRCANGDYSAWSRFVECFSPLVFFAIKSKISKLYPGLPESDIYDIYQRVFLSIWQKQKLKRIKNPKSISRWLVIVAQNEAVDYIASKHPLKVSDAADDIDIALNFTPLDETNKDELEKELEVFIDALPLKERRIATLDILYSLKYAQISKIVNLPIGTVSSVIKRIKTDLKQYLHKKGYKV